MTLSSHFLWILWVQVYWPVFIIQTAKLLLSPPAMAGLGWTGLGGNMRNYLSCYLVLIRLLILWAGWYWWSLTLIHALQETMQTSITLHLTLRISQMWLWIARLIFNIQKILWRQPQKYSAETETIIFLQNICFYHLWTTDQCCSRLMCSDERSSQVMSTSLASGENTSITDNTLNTPAK